jgi:hypothetical protein
MTLGQDVNEDLLYVKFTPKDDVLNLLISISLLWVVVCETLQSKVFWEEFEDTKGVMRIRKSKKNRQYNFDRTWNEPLIAIWAWKIVLFDEIQAMKAAIFVLDGVHIARSCLAHDQ